MMIQTGSHVALLLATAEGRSERASATLNCYNPFPSAVNWATATEGDDKRTARSAPPRGHAYCLKEERATDFL